MARDLVNFDPFAEFQALQKRFFEDGPFAGLHSHDLPITDVYTTEDDKSFVVEAQLPEFSDKDVSVDIDDGTLVIQAQKQDRDEDKQHGKRYVLRESRTSVYRRIALPDQVDAENASASFDKGVLTVTVPLRALPAPKKIAISSTK